MTKQDEFFIAELFDAQSESVVWFQPVWNKNEKEEGRVIADFQVGYCNQAATVFLSAPKEAILGKTLLSNNLLDDASNKLIFDQCRQVYETGEVQEYTYYNDYLKKYYNVLRSKVKDGVLAVSRDRTKQYLAELEFEKQSRKYNAIIDTSADGILLLEAIRDSNNKIADFKIVRSNKPGQRLGKLPEDAQCRTLLQLLPHLKNSEQFHLHTVVVETGEPVQFETTFRNEKGEEYGWFIVSLSKIDDGLLSRFVDISEKKLNEIKTLKQAEYLNSILEASIDGVFVCEAVRDEGGRIIDLLITKINTGFTRMVGKTAEEVEGKLYLQLFPAAHDAGLFTLNCSVIETGVPVRKEVYYNGEGLNAWFEISLVRLDENGLVVTFSDVTKSKQSLAETEQHRNLLNSILEHSPSGIAVTEFIKDKDGKVYDGRIILANNAAARYVGMEKEEYMSKNIVEHDPKFFESAFFKMILKTLETGEPFLTQYYVEQYEKWLEIGVSKLDDNRVIYVFTDVTDIKNGQIKLEKLVEDLKKSNANLEEFTYAASHDLKEPIRKISVFTNRLKSIYSKVKSEEGERTMERLENATERMQLLIDDLLEFSHVSERPLEFEEVDLGEKIRKVLNDLEVVIEEKQAKIKLGDLPVMKGFRRQLQQLFQNLLSNSLKYSKEEVKPEISVTCKIVDGKNLPTEHAGLHQADAYYLIEVTDNGIGFEQQYASRIFNMFQRLHGRSEYSGTGVGLSIARKVVENHNGIITAEGRPGEGATFRVYLPVNPVEV